ncbi:hypothetical protein [Tenacibaculum finnmarkense]|uniref:hypothetical protein n=1 Tax=Tenacibaculum finnmarkense TaxID=2781243 RepID=UPI001EFB2EF8|nr:hypothetical protein [Tenacibaculum finnmarkense]MCG8749465.1 hypothetical protein [Tenacibaculum finnmarkense]MCG8754305.1 hypothetical protein [Tenacibaculum finnmarkense]MCG8783001.1 hypothetical protein [Tenacibaculum finnmarkense]
MTQGKPEKLIKLLNQLLSEKNDSKKGDIQLEVGQEVVKLNLVDGDDSQNAYYMMLVRHSVNEYLQDNCSDEKASQIQLTINKLEDTVVNIR